MYFAFAPALLVFMYFCRFSRREAVLYLKKNKLRILTKTEKMKCEESAPDRSSMDIVLCSGNGAEYLRYLHGLTQPVVFLMSSYRNWPTLSYKSSIILKQSAAVIWESDFSTCTAGHHYKRVCSCHCSSSTWFYTQPCKKCNEMQKSFDRTVLMIFFWTHV